MPYVVLKGTLRYIHIPNYNENPGIIYYAVVNAM